jgi:hypothetical protein
MLKNICKHVFWEDDEHRFCFSEVETYKQKNSSLITYKNIMLCTEKNCPILKKCKKAIPPGESPWAG